MARYDPWSAELRADPYPTYRAMRDTDPVQHLPSAGLWFLTRYADCVAVLRDPSFSARHGQRIRLRRTALPPSMLTADGPEHRRLRGALAPAFGATALRRARPGIAALVDDGLRRFTAELRTGRDADLMAGFARPLAGSVLARTLGLPPAEESAFARLGSAVAANLDPVADPGAAAAAAMDDLLGGFAGHLHARGTDPRDDALTVLAAAHARGTLAADEVLAAAALLVVGGLEPLADLLGNAAAALLAEP
ncbi:MAG TPA: hypothetical protein VGD67_05230, partial [Pseudonocardiaceae bacterium]